MEFHYGTNLLLKISKEEYENTIHFSDRSAARCPAIPTALC